MWALHNTSFTPSPWINPPPQPHAIAVSFDDHPVNPSLSSPCEDEISISTSSFTNASAHSALTIESSHRPPPETTASSTELMAGGGHNSSHHLWSHFLLNDGTCEDMDKYQQPEIRENIDTISLKGATHGGIFEQAAACDYLKKLDNNYWDKPFDHKDYFNSNRLSSKFSDLLTTNWSIAKPHEYDNLDSDRFPCKGYGDLNAETEDSYDVGLHQKGTNKDVSCGSSRSLADLISFGSRLIGKPSSPDGKVTRPSSGSSAKKLGLKSTSPAGSNGRENGSGNTNEGKRKRSTGDSSSEKLQKKHKHENSTVNATSPKVPVPKVKLGDRIATLQQIVSPFGKTDTASVLMEAITYIKFLQEQVQLLISNPYLKTHPHREYPWGEIVDRKEVKLDLKRRGLCLIPISCTPQLYRENTGSDYWAPPYRGVFYG